MANNSYTQQALASDPQFHARVRAALGVVAWQVIGESESTPHHAEREAYARNTVLPNLALVAQQISQWLVERTNLLGADTSYDFEGKQVITAATDAEIASQIATDWDILAGVP